ncbi:Cell division protein FtsN [Sinobacterium norvegicum]|uniref:Cell division protein FtsN n=1 Tax=Sinobacterium norvegicum TaxID=1641715 RepID=A0ABM9AF69_9GAMM|nr:SPOR domain-containing protein [Sinobacterium norvegicum]CAH0991847.1 Cell division protein FtsN [Sinobacterium norvegicum]
MGKDFAKKKPAAAKKKRPVNKKKPAKKSSSVPGWVWLFTGLVAGGFIAFLAYLASGAGGGPAEAKKTPQASEGKKIPVSNQSQPAEKSSQTDYEFYRILRDSEVTVEVDPLQRESIKKSSVKYDYFIQAGSFRSQSDADSHRANLIIQGMQATIDGPEKGKKGWYRVIVGPFGQNAGNLSSTRAKLVDQGFDTMVIKRKKG